MTIIRYIADKAASYGMTLDKIISPTTGEAARYRDSIALFLIRERGLQASDVSDFLDIPVKYIKGLLQK